MDDMDAYISPAQRRAMEAERKAREERQKIEEEIARYASYADCYFFSEIMYLSDCFDQAYPNGVGRIPERACMEITGTWMQHRYPRRLDTYDTQPDLLQQAASDLSLDLTQGVNFMQVVKLVYNYQDLHLSREASAGFKRSEVAYFEKRYKGYDKNGEGLKARALWSIFGDMGIHFRTHDEQLWMIETVKEMDKDKSGTIDFDEFCQLVRKIVDKRQQDARSREHSLIVQSGMSFPEAEEWHTIFEIYDEDGSGELALKTIRSLFLNIGLKWPNEGNEQLLEMINDMDDNKNGVIDFGEFCGLVKKMWDANFYGIREVTKGATKDGAQQAKEGTLGAQVQGRRRKSWAAERPVPLGQGAEDEEYPDPGTPQSPTSPTSKRNVAAWDKALEDNMAGGSA